MTGAIEFLRKAKAICKENISCSICPLRRDLCSMVLTDIISEADLVRKVMEYQVEEVFNRR